MALNIRPKVFGPVHVRFDGGETVTFSYGDGSEWQPHPPQASPVVTMLASVGHCLLESLRIAARREKMTPEAFTISVKGEKALDLPGRIRSIECVLEGWPVGQSGAAELVAEAKSICTVSNTLNAEISVTTGANA